MNVLEEVAKEREHQREKWGDEHDSHHTNEDFFWLVEHRIVGESTRHQLIEAAALIVAWIEASDKHNESDEQN